MHLQNIFKRLQASRLLLAVILLTLISGATIASAIPDSQPRAKAKFVFGLWGDMPYSPEDAVTKVPTLIRDMNDANLAFTIFDGDTKSGSSLCTNAMNVDQAKARFNTLEAPTVYVPGDNEWTDCHRTNNGGYNNLERLDYLRKNMFNTEESFGKNKMLLGHQGPVGGPYSENVRWIYSDVLFVGINVPGSNNNKTSPADCPTPSNSVRTQADCDADNAEYRERDSKNIQWLHEAFVLAKQEHLVGILVDIQADLWFDLPETVANERADPSVNGYTNFINTLVSETYAYNGQVVLVHGDTHFFKIDKPLIDQAHLISNLTRVQTFGQVNVHWVKVTVDPNSRNVFTFEPMIVPGN